MTSLAIDYAWAHPNPSAITAAGYTQVFRYLSTDPTKNLTGPEVAQLHAAGLQVGLVWETTAQRSLDGSQAGLQDATAAIALARGLGYPNGNVLFANVGDFAATPQQIPSIMAYYGGWRATVVASSYTAGGYGTGYILAQLAPMGGYWWQNAEDDEGFPGSVVIPVADVYQRVAPTLFVAGAVGDYDEDVIIRPVPMWGPAVIPPPVNPVNPPQPPPPTKLEDEDMPLYVFAQEASDDGSIPLNNQYVIEGDHHYQVSNPLPYKAKYGDPVPMHGNDIAKTS